VRGITEARRIFMKARKEPNCTYHLYLASAMMEFYHNKDPEQARKIFLVGLNGDFANETDFIVHYLKFLWNMNDNQNTRAMFERVLKSLPPESCKMIWNLYLEFEYVCGDADTVSRLEKRRAEAYRMEDTNGILALVNRHRYEDLWPCDLATLESFQGDEIVEKDDSELARKQQEERMNKYPRPDFSQMLPFTAPMAAINPSTLGLPSLPVGSSDSSSEILPNDVPDNGEYCNLPECLATFIAQLPREPFLGQAPDVEAIIQEIQKVDLPPLQDASSALGKRGSQPGGEPEQKKQRTTQQDVWRKRQAMKRKL